MNIIEAVKLARGGKRIRRIDWDQKVFVYLDQITFALHWSNDDPFILLYSHVIGEWEEYEVKIEIKTYTFQEALTALGNGKMISRVRKSGLAIHMNRAREMDELILFNYDDVHADDWRIIE